MAHRLTAKNAVRLHRNRRGWSQDELARRAGISRTAVSAIELHRLVPSVTAALALARVLDCTVEDLYGQRAGLSTEPAWAWLPPRVPTRYWHAHVKGRVLYYPVEATPAGEVAHDGIFQNDLFIPNHSGEPETTLVLACCDPAASLLAAEYYRASGFRLLVLNRGSRAALNLLAQGLLHVAGVHLASSDAPRANIQAVSDTLGQGYSLLHVAHWEAGLSVTPSSRLSTIGAVLRGRLRWVGREPGSAARQCLDQLRPHHPPPRRLASDHRGVAEAVLCGWADVGVCHRLVSEEAGLRFFPVRQDCFDLCYPTSAEGDPRLKALKQVVQTVNYRRLLGDLPGYAVHRTGEWQRVT